MRHQCAAQHFLRFFGGFGNGFRQTYTASLASFGFFERTFTATTCVDLRFNNPKRAVEFASGGLRVFSLKNRTTVGNGCSIFFQQLFCLIFVDVHSTGPYSMVHGINVQRYE